MVTSVYYSLFSPKEILKDLLNHLSAHTRLLSSNFIAWSKLVSLSLPSPFPFPATTLGLRHRLQPLTVLPQRSASHDSRRYAGSELDPG